MEILNAKCATPIDNPHKVLAQSVYGNEHVQVTMITLEPGETLKPHRTPVDVVFYGLEGLGVVVVGEEEGPLGVDDLVFSPKKITHLLRNDGDATFRFLVLKTPNPAGR